MQQVVLMSPAFCILMDQSAEGAYWLCVHSDRRWPASNSESRQHCVKAMGMVCRAQGFS